MHSRKAEKPTTRLKDVAKRAHVSPATASMIFTGTGRISQETKDRVFRVAEELGYVHKKREKKSIKAGNHVALLMLIDPEWTFIWHFLTEMINRIQQELGQRGYKTVMIPISHYEDDETIYNKISQLGCRSVFSIHFGNERLFKRLEADDIPVVVIMNSNFQETYYSICIDDFDGAYEGTRHLLNMGHRRIDFVDSTRQDLPALSPDRFFGYRKALEEAGMEFDTRQKIICNIDTTEEELEQRLLQTMNTGDAPTALFCLDDEIALRAWYALERLGYSIPSDMSILAPGDVLDYTKPYIPCISTMRIDMNYVGRLASEMLLNRLNSGSDTVHVLKVKQQLKDRGSCVAVKPPSDS